MISTTWYAACGMVILLGCRKTDEVPAYVVIPAVSVSATDAQGGSTSKITDVWVSLNDRSVGVWELPARVPVLGTGPNTISVTPAVKRNGSFDDRLRYPYYSTWSATLDLVPEQAVGAAPMVGYVEAVDFWLERFNEAGNLFNVSDDSDTTLLLYTATENPEVVLDGTSCGGFVLETGRDRINLYTNENFDPANGPAYIELDYSTDINLTIGLSYTESGSSQAEPWILLVPTTQEGGLKWNKVYIDVSSFFNVAGLSQRNIYIAAALPPGQATAHVYLDNFKLIRAAS